MQTERTKRKRTLQRFKERLEAQHTYSQGLNSQKPIVTKYLNSTGDTMAGTWKLNGLIRCMVAKYAALREYLAEKQRHLQASESRHVSFDYALDNRGHQRPETLSRPRQHLRWQRTSWTPIRAESRGLWWVSSMGTWVVASLTCPRLSRCRATYAACTAHRFPTRHKQHQRVVNTTRSKDRHSLGVNKHNSRRHGGI